MRQVSENHACYMAESFRRELQEANAEIQSSEFLRAAGRLYESGHANRLPALLLQYRFQADIRVSYADIGLSHDHPMLQVSDTIAALDTAGKLEDVLLMGNTQDDLKEFWTRLRQTQPNHAVFRENKPYSNTLPMYLHADEGISLKKKGILILQTQCVIGFGSARAGGLNFLGTTYVTRLLFAVLLSRLYTKKPTILYNLLEVWSRDLQKLFDQGVMVKLCGKQQRIYLAFLGCKGDWPALAKLGRLCRHHLRDAPSADSPPGICHLCRAGQNGFPWHTFGFDAPWLCTQGPGNPLPWNHASPLASLPQNEDLADFYKIDIFHTCHKGVVGDYVASTIAP